MPKTFFDAFSFLFDLLITSPPEQKIIHLLNSTKNSKIIDIGGGTGRSTVLLSNICKELWILDPSKAMLERAMEKNPNIKSVHAFTEAIPFPSSSFDGVLAIDSLHHWDNQQLAIREIHRILKPDSVLVINDFDPRTRRGMFIKIMEKILFMGSTFFTPKELSLILLKEGFNITEFEQQNGTYTIAARKKG